MKLYVCYGTWTAGKPVHAHPCGEAHKALTEAGHRPEVVRSYGLGPLPGFINDLTPGRREVKELTGSYWVPVLVLDDGTVVKGSKRIIAWAQANPPSSLADVGTRAASAPATATTDG
ncbi:MAG: glutathione S-transferase domain-containing protein [Actinomycetota bacterium]|nr:glutathione S-transferase domain-containing protein [Actinomycetota bacterium]